MMKSEKKLRLLMVVCFLASSFCLFAGQGGGGGGGGGGNTPPTADAGADSVIPDSDGLSGENVALDGSGSSDSDGTIDNYIWVEGGNTIANGVNPTVSLSDGIHAINLVVVDNDGVNGSDAVVITVEPPSSSTNTPATTYPDGMTKPYAIIAVGTVRGEGKIVTLEGVRRKTWAKYALWSDDNRSIYFKSDEKFYGPVHANSPLYFSGDPEFFDDVTSTSTSYGGSTNNAIFHNGFDMGVPTDSMADVDFSDLESKSTLIITGVTEITFSTTNMLISNSHMGWTNEPVLIGPNEVVYIKEGTGGGSDEYGDAYVGGELDGRVSVVTERDINITNNLTYFDDPKTNSASDDALGLISQRNVVVKPSCPDDLDIYAHIMATGNSTPQDTDGSFGVENYNSGSPRGNLNVHGGIAQDYRGAVGTFSTQSGQSISGYDKNYTYDMRFSSAPPPEYPPLSNEIQFEKWRDH